MPVSVSSRLEPVSESDTGKTFIASSAGADSVMIVLARRNQAVNASHTTQPYPAPAAEKLEVCAATRVRYAISVALRGLKVCSIEREWTPVAAVCDVCGKRPGFGHNVPWSKKKTNRRWDPNIQRVRATVAGSPKRLNVCASCLKAGKVMR